MCVFLKCYVSLVRIPAGTPPRLVRLFVVNTGLGVSLACLVRWLKKSTSTAPVHADRRVTHIYIYVYI